MKPFVLNMTPADFADGKLTEAGRASAREQLLGKFKAAMEADIGPTPEGMEDKVRQALIDKIDRGLEQALSGASGAGIVQLSASTMLEALKRAMDMLEAMPEGLNLTAKAVASCGNGASAKTIFELGQASAQVALAMAAIHVAQEGLKHLIECDCSELSTESETSTKTDTTNTKAAAQA